MSDSWKSSVDTSPEVMQLLEAVAQRHGLHDCARGAAGEVGLGAAPDAYAALFVNKSGLTLSLNPSAATRLVDTGRFTLLKRNATTHYVRVPNALIRDPNWAPMIQQAVEAAVERSWQGPRWNRGPNSGQRSSTTKICPVHFVQLPATGWCDDCDDYAPAQ